MPHQGQCKKDGKRNGGVVQSNASNLVSLTALSLLLGSNLNLRCWGTLVDGQRSRV